MKPCEVSTCLRGPRNENKCSASDSASSSYFCGVVVVDVLVVVMVLVVRVVLAVLVVLEVVDVVVVVLAVEVFELYV